MATEERSRTVVVPSRRLWFGLVTAAAAWVSVGIGDLLVEWRTCMRYGSPMPPPGHDLGRGLAFGLALVLLIIAITAGITSYRNWRRLSQEGQLVEALGTERPEFMALMGVFVSVTLGMGILWLSLPPLIITVCQRAK